MSSIALFMAFLLLLHMHACNARNTFAFVSYTKEYANEKADLHETNVKASLLSDRKETLLGGETKSLASFDKHQGATEMKGLKDQKARLMLESPTVHEATHHNADEEEGDVAVTDYVSPHRKSPIHNHH